MARGTLTQRRALASVSLSVLRPAKGSNRKRKRVGRGRGLGGRQCGRGNSGQLSRSGPGLPRGFEGGQTPLHKRLPKVGRRAGVAERPFTPLSLGRLQRLVDTQRVCAGRVVDLGALHAAGVRDLVRNGPRPGGVVVTAEGAERFCARVHVQASAFGPGAAEHIEALGGTAVAVYHDHASLRRIAKTSPAPQSAVRLAFAVRHARDGRPVSAPVPSVENRASSHCGNGAAKTPEETLRAMPMPPHEPPMSTTARIFYSSAANRGYLNPEVQARLLREDPSFAARYRLAAPAFRAPYTPPRLADIVPDLRREGLLPS